MGLDFLSHIFWDKYLEFEERLELRDQIFAILKRIILIPMHQYARYFERYRSMAASRPIVELAEPEILQGFQIAMETESADAALTAGLQYIPRSELDAETEIRLRIDAYNLEIFGRTQMETTKRWTYEQEIKRPYFLVKDLDETELINWRKYLAFEESEGDYARVCFLYERCLVTCAFYDEFWFRYIRFMSAQEEQAAKQMQQLQQLTAPAGAPGAAPPPAPVPPKKTEEIRNIYLRAACFFVPIALPQIRLNFAYFEEVHGRPEVAAAIHQAILLALPHHLPSIISWAHLVRRTHGLDPAVAVLQSFLDPAPADPTGAAETPTPVPAPVRAALTTEWALMLWRAEGQVDEARRVFLKGKETDCCRESAVFWDGYLTFELEMGGCGGGGGSAGGRPQEAQIRQEAVLRAVVEGIRKSSVEGPVREGLLRRWMGYLMERGRGAGCMAEWLVVEREVAGGL